ncbi:phospholipid/cholesterol/gamma-HCH transport system substrate-binding protein [Roseateles sp. YR242]|uniref:MlaD family protein n=1 Tax=Roseateles sp. YR242 TaxID=1855305 RepID=UPI0008C04C55|nr:MlaD family protein [Roseateles sp. YR242]SEL01299.1 phospholipid/cholesterol/gamma-HCH transport system substrate-binding protein [Roseateles sp. YR242]
MENKAHALATGLFVLLLGAALVAVVMWFRDSRGDTQSFTVVSRAGVPGLNVKAPVKLRGVMIGKVASIRFDPAEPRQILVGIDVDVDAPITAGTVAKLGYQGITGLSFIDLNDGEPPANPQQSVLQTRRIALAPSILDQLTDIGPKLAATAMDTMKRINLVLNDSNQQQFSQTLTQLKEASAGLNQLVSELHPTAKALPSLIKNADGLVVAGQHTLGRVDHLAQQGGEMVDAYKARAAELDKIGDAAAQLQASIKRIEQALVGANERPRQQALVDDLSRAARALERAAQGLSDQPQSLLLGPRPAPAGPGEAGFDPSGKEQ